MIADFASWVSLSWGWRRRGIAVVAGLLSLAAFPPFFFPPILFLTIPVLIWLLDGALDAPPGSARVRRIVPPFATGWWFGFGFFMGGLYWIGEAFLVDAGAHAWLMPIAVVAMAGGMAAFYGVAAVIARLFWTDNGARIAALALAMGGLELVRGFVFTGFPWNTFGYALTAYDITMQSASLFGIYGLTVLAVLVFGAPAVFADEHPSWRMPVLALAIVAGVTGYGVWRLDNRIATAADDAIGVRLVQANILQSEKWLPEKRTSIFSSYLDLTGAETPRVDGAAIVDAPTPKIVIWPESAPPFLLDREPGALAAIAAVLRPDQVLITGANRVDGAFVGDDYTIYNSLYLIDGFGGILDRYDKLRLVPFGESLPFEAKLRAWGVDTLVSFPGTFRPGRVAKNLSGAGTPAFRPLICYEIIFSGAILSGVERPRWIVNVTNDAWFGSSIGPHQHLHKSRVRAVELGLPVARAANTGISAMIDGYGMVIDSIPLNTSGFVDTRLPEALPETPYTRSPISLVSGVLIFTAFVWVSGFRRARRRNQR